MDLKSHELYGRRILHVLSPVRWNAQKYLHHLDSNFKCLTRIIDWLPMCHHYVLVPQNHEIPNDRPNVTWVKHPYPASVLYNRGYFDSKAFLKWFDSTKIDVDFVHSHQPELLYNVMNALQTARYGLTTAKMVFFHWVDCPKSRPTGNYPPGFFRQLEGITISNKGYFHSPEAFDWLKTNWEEHQIVNPINDTTASDKISYMPTSLEDWGNLVSEPFELPNKKILVFNHRWNKTTGVDKLKSYTKDLNMDEYLVWVTDKDAKHPKAGKPAPDWMHVQSLTRGQYKYLLENAYAGLSFVDKYATWNLSIQDCLSVNLPTLVFEHPVFKPVIGDENYPYYFTDKKQFLEKLPQVSDDFTWELPDHDKVFRETLIKDMIDSLPKVKREPSAGREWLYHILKGNGYKKNLLFNSHTHLFASNVWEGLRLWCLQQGIQDDPHSTFTKLSIPEDKVEDIKKIVGDLDFGESLENPMFVVKENKFF